MSLPPPLRMQDKAMEMIRSRIESKEWHTGFLLPPAEELARLTGTGPTTMHKALARLAEEGWVKRIRRLGTFVQATPSASVGGAIVTPPKPGGEGVKRLAVFQQLVANRRFAGAFFSRHITDEVQQRLLLEGTPYQVWTAPYTRMDDPSPADEFVAAMAEGGFDGLILSGLSRAVFARIDALGLPMARATGMEGVRGGVLPDLRYFPEQAAGILTGAGHRRIGVIANLFTHTPEAILSSTDLPSDAPRFEVGLRSVRDRFDVELRPEWMVTTQMECQPYNPVDNTAGEISFEEFGYWAFNRIWDQPERPDALMVYPDMAARGVVMAMIERRVSVPDELSVVFHKNSGFEFCAPFPITFLCVNVGNYADMLIRTAKGELHSPVFLPMELEYSPGIRGSRLP